MTVWDWLNSPTGIDLVHALIVLIAAVSAYVSYLAKRETAQSKKLLNSHLEQHVLDAVEKKSVDK